MLSIVRVADGNRHKYVKVRGSPRNDDEKKSERGKKERINKRRTDKRRELFTQRPSQSRALTFVLCLAWHPPLLHIYYCGVL